MMKIGFIDYYLDEWHANNYPQMLREASGGEMEVVCAYGMIEHPNGGRTTEQWCADMGIPQAATIEEVIEKSDCLVVLSPDNCEMHERLCQLPLRSGKPTYVDKTFAPDGPTARRIFAIAEESGTPCWSTSALRYADAYQGIEGVKAIASWGPNGFETYSIHQLEPVIMLMKADPKRVMWMPGEKWYTLAIEFDGGRVATIAGYEGGSPFMMNVATETGAKVLRAEGGYFEGFIAALVEFFHDPAKAVPHEETVRIMAVRGAALKAMETPGVWMNVEE